MWKQPNGIQAILCTIPLSKCIICVVTNFLSAWVSIQFVVIWYTFASWFVSIDAQHLLTTWFYFFALRSHSSHSFPQFVAILRFSLLENKWWFPSLLRRLLSIFSNIGMCVCMYMCALTFECICTVYLNYQCVENLKIFMEKSKPLTLM